MTESHLAQAAPTAIMHAPARKAVNIIAMGSSRSDFFQAQLMESRPEILQNAETWCINYMGAQIRCDRIIHVDPVHPYLGHPVVRDMCEYALKDNTPFYTSWPHPRYSNHVVYPFARVMASFGGITYFNTSVSYAIALALADGFNEIGLFGCDFSYPDVHLAESGRACCEFYMGIGTQRGVRFAVAQNSTLMDMYNKQQPYGWFVDPNHPPGMGGKIMTAQQILAHEERIRNPPKLAAQFQVIQVASPSVIQPIAAPQPVMGMGGEHAIYNAVLGGPLPLTNGHDPSLGVENAPSNIQLPHANG